MKKLFFLLISAISTPSMHSLSSYSNYHFRSGGGLDWLCTSPLTPLMLGICTTGIAVKALEDTHIIDVEHDTLSLITGVGAGATVAAALYGFIKESQLITDNISSALLIAGGAYSAGLLVGGTYYFLRPAQRIHLAKARAEKLWNTGEKQSFIETIIENHFQYKVSVSNKNMEDFFKNNLRLLYINYTGRDSLKLIYEQCREHDKKLEYAERYLKKIQPIDTRKTTKVLLTNITFQKDYTRSLMASTKTQMSQSLKRKSSFNLDFLFKLCEKFLKF